MQTQPWVRVSSHFLPRCNFRAPNNDLIKIMSRGRRQDCKYVLHIYVADLYMPFQSLKIIPETGPDPPGHLCQQTQPQGNPSAVLKCLHNSFLLR